MSRAPIRYVRGDHKAVCDGCGKYFLASDLRKRWDGMMVCASDYEMRHPQDFVRARQDQQAVPWSRPTTADDFSLNTQIPTTETVPLGTFTL
jgi:hypothetical protein